MGLQVALALLVLVVAGLFFQRFQEGRGLDPGFRAEGVLLAAYDCRGRDADAGRQPRVRGARAARPARACRASSPRRWRSSVPLDIHGLPSRSFALEGRADTGTPDERAVQHRDERLPRDHGHPARRRHRLRRPRRRGGAAAGHRQPGVRRRATRRTARSSADGSCRGASRTSSSASPARPPTTRSARRRRRWCSIRIGIARSPPPRCTCARAPAPSWRWPRRIRRVVADLDPSLPVFDVRTLPEHIARNLVLRRVPARMFLVLGPLLLLLAAIGVYAVVDYGVSQRTSEIAVRLALGATSQAVVRRIVAETLAVIGLGVGASTILAVARGSAPGTRRAPRRARAGRRAAAALGSRGGGGVAAGQTREPRAAGERPPRDLAGLALPCAAVTILREHSISRIYLSTCRMRFGSSRPRSSRRWPTPPASPSSRRCATASCPPASCSTCSRSSRRTCRSISRCCEPSRSW